MRHFLRSKLFDRSPTLFPWGKSFAAIEDVLENICHLRPIMCPQVTCNSCNCVPYDLQSQSLPCFPSLTGVECGKSVFSSQSTSPLGVGEATWDEWWRGLAFSHIPPPGLQQYGMLCQHCGSSSGFTYTLKVSTTPRLIYFNTFGFPNLVPAMHFVLHTLEGSTIHYHLGALVYYGTNHFTSRILLKNGSVWSYDGMVNGGIMNLDTTLDFSNPFLPIHMKEHEGRTLSNFLYVSFPPPLLV